MKWNLIILAAKYAAVDKTRDAWESIGHYTDWGTLSILLSTRHHACALVPQYLSSNCRFEAKIIRICRLVPTFRFIITLMIMDESATPREPRWTDEELLSTIQQIDYLKTVVLHHLEQVTDAVLPAIAALPFLEHFAAESDCHKISLRGQLDSIVVPATSSKLKTSALSSLHMNWEEKFHGDSAASSEELAQHAQLSRDFQAEVLKLLDMRGVNPELHAAAFAAAPAIVGSRAAEVKPPPEFMDAVLNHALSWAMLSEFEPVALSSLSFIEQLCRVEPDAAREHPEIIAALLDDAQSSSARSGIVRAFVLRILQHPKVEELLTDEQRLIHLRAIHDALLSGNHFLCRGAVRILASVLGKSSTFFSSEKAAPIVGTIFGHLIALQRRQQDETSGGELESLVSETRRLLCKCSIDFFPRKKSFGAEWREMVEQIVQKWREDEKNVAEEEDVSLVTYDFEIEKLYREMQVESSGRLVDSIIEADEPCDSGSPEMIALKAVDDSDVRKERLKASFPWTMWRREMIETYRPKGWKAGTSDNDILFPML